MTFPPRIGEGGKVTDNQDFEVGDDIAFNVSYKQAGPNPVDLLERFRWLYLEPNYDSATQQAIISFAKRKLREQHSTSAPATLMQGEKHFITAFAPEQKKVTSEFLDNLRAGKEIVFIIVQLTYKDNGQIHHLRRCQWLQPPAVPPGVWQFCEGFNGSD